MTAYPQKITFGELRASGVRDVLVYCRDYRCSHHIEISADRRPDQVRLSTSTPASSAPPAASAARRCGQSFRRPHGHRLGAAPLQLHRALPALEGGAAAVRAALGSRNQVRRLSADGAPGWLAGPLLHARRLRLGGPLPGYR